MAASKVKFGDKIFLYGQFMEPDNWEEMGFANPQYNSVMGYIPIGGYGITPQETEIVGACLPGFVVDFLQGSSLAFAAPFADEELIDVSSKLSLQAPIQDGVKIWMPLFHL